MVEIQNPQLVHGAAGLAYEHGCDSRAKEGAGGAIKRVQGLAGEDKQCRGGPTRKRLVA
jgi:hypothetical protein